MQRQRLLKYINENQLHEALKFAKDVLLPLTEGNDFLYKELEKTMCLLAYENLDDAAEKEMLTDKFWKNCFKYKFSYIKLYIRR